MTHSVHLLGEFVAMQQGQRAGILTLDPLLDHLVGEHE
jgi:hypothetical protein